MCGIVGVLCFDGAAAPMDASLLERMRDELSHRGPDGTGLWVSGDRRVGLGHRRLSIIDLSTAADQPMGNEDGAIQIVFNGEIYNHAEIRAELQREGGHAWKTDHSDTEVILHAYEQWGIDCLNRFRGMFAFALWDARKGLLWLVRDRIGVKPLYYAVRDGRLSFASEIKALLRDPAIPRRVDEEGLLSYLSFISVPAPRTMFEGIRKLEAGTWVRADLAGNISTRRWWDVWDHVQPGSAGSLDDLPERILEELRTSVRLRKISDVPVGVFLSGGIDSSTNARLFSEEEGRPVHAFSVGYEGDNPSYRNELDYARLMAREVGADHREILLSEDHLVDFLPRMIWHQDEPIGDPVCVPLYYVSKLARDAGVVVCQVGEGADELFMGYPLWRDRLRLEKAARLPGAGAAFRLGMACLSFMGRVRTTPFELLERAVDGYPVFWGGVDVFTERMKAQVASPELLRRHGGFSPWAALEPLRARFLDKAWEKTPLQWMTFMDLSLRLPELLLMRVDKMTMATGVEARVPFLDHKFVELALGIPEAVKLRGGGLKPLLKKAVANLVPLEIRRRPKQGFGIPIKEWFQRRLAPLATAEILAFARASGYLRVAGLEERLRRLGTARTWYLFNLALWWKTFIAGGGAGR